MDGEPDVPAESRWISAVRAVSVGAAPQGVPDHRLRSEPEQRQILTGTIVNELVKPKEGESIVRLGHASGVTAVDIKIDGDHVIQAASQELRAGSWMAMYM